MLKKFLQPFRQQPPSLATAKPTPNLSGLLAERYAHQVTQQHIQYDAAQVATLVYLQKILESLALNAASTSKQVVACQSLYIFGDVGRGKSMLMALFYEACPISKKRRVHFNAFMQEVHAFTHEWRQQNNSDAIAALAENIRRSAQLLCFDEFHVTDIADAMILGRLFGELFAQGIIVVITSNRHPNDLYQGGLQREQFLFFIKLLQTAATIIELEANEDYRLSSTASPHVSYYCPDTIGGATEEFTERARQFIRQRYNALTDAAPLQSGVIQVFGREIRLTAVHNDVLLSSFDELCAQPLGAADYLAIARRFNTVIIEGIPQLAAEKRNEAKRFLTLVDVLYEHKIKLICSAQVPAPALYTEGDGAFEFRRTVSRLIEMQSDGYCRQALANCK
jgi:cell division protein ZapE